mmetsp:Transcript_25572/g.73484  ORF Transcript_25572/g.73484 Transcript_25572/m.73484 type:complete len:207 (-) Transcript_25572:452-1072(-)
MMKHQARSSTPASASRPTNFVSTGKVKTVSVPKRAPCMLMRSEKKGRQAPTRHTPSSRPSRISAAAKLAQRSETSWRFCRPRSRLNASGLSKRGIVAQQCTVNSKRQADRIGPDGSERSIGLWRDLPKRRKAVTITTASMASAQHQAILIDCFCWVGSRIAPKIVGSEAWPPNTRTKDDDATGKPCISRSVKWVSPADAGPSCTSK